MTKNTPVPTVAPTPNIASWNVPIPRDSGEVDAATGVIGLRRNSSRPTLTAPDARSGVPDRAGEECDLVGRDPAAAADEPSAAIHPLARMVVDRRAAARPGPGVRVPRLTAVRIRDERQ